MGSPLIDKALEERGTLHPITLLPPSPDVKRMRRERDEVVEKGVVFSCKVEEGVDVRRRLSDPTLPSPVTVLKASPALRVCEPQPAPPQLDGEWSDDDSHESRDSDSRDSREESGSGGDSREGQDVEDWSMEIAGSGAPDSPSLLLKRGYAALLQKVQTRKAFTPTRATGITVL